MHCVMLGFVVVLVRLGYLVVPQNIVKVVLMCVSDSEENIR